MGNSGWGGIKCETKSIACVLYKDYWFDENVYVKSVAMDYHLSGTDFSMSA